MSNPAYIHNDSHTLFPPTLSKNQLFLKQEFQVAHTMYCNCQQTTYGSGNQLLPAMCFLIKGRGDRVSYTFGYLICHDKMWPIGWIPPMSLATYWVESRLWVLCYWIESRLHSWLTLSLSSCLTFTCKTQLTRTTIWPNSRQPTLIPRSPVLTVSLGCDGYQKVALWLFAIYIRLYI